MKLLNGDDHTHGDPKMPIKIVPVLTKRGREKLKRQKELKDSVTLKFKIGGPVVITFD